MTEVGDRVEVTSRKGAPRQGMITAVHAGMVTIQWDSGEESSLIPGPGVLSVVPGRGRGPRRSARATKAVSWGAAPPARTPARRAVTAGKTAPAKAKAKAAKAKAKAGKAKATSAKAPPKRTGKAKATSAKAPPKRTGKASPAARARAAANKATKATKKKAR